MTTNEENPENAKSPEGEVVTPSNKAYSSSNDRKKMFLAAGMVGVLSVTAVLAFFAGKETGDPQTSKNSSSSSFQNSAASPSMAGDRMPSYGGERIVFKSEGLSDADGNAMAWAYDPSASFSKEKAEEIGAAFGLTGEAELRYGSWAMGSSDWSSASLQLQPDGLTSFNYYNPQLDPYACMDGPSSIEGTAYQKGDATTVSDPAAPEPVPLPAPDVAPAPDCASAPEPLDPAEAEGKAKELVETLGFEGDDYQFKASLSDSITYVDVSLSGAEGVGSWGLSYYGPELQSAYGVIAPRVELGQYPIIGAQEAVERLGDSRYAAFDSFMHAGANARDMSDSSAQVLPDSNMGVTPEGEDGTPLEWYDDVPATPPTPPVAGEAIEWPVRTATFTQAKESSMLYTAPSGATMILPAWELSTADGEVWSIVAVKEESLNFG